MSKNIKKYLDKLRQEKYNFKDFLKFLMENQKGTDLAYKQFATKIQLEMIPEFLKSLSSKKKMTLIGSEDLFDIFETLNSMLESIDQKTNLNPVMRYFSES